MLKNLKLKDHHRRRMEKTRKTWKTWKIRVVGHATFSRFSDFQRSISLLECPSHALTNVKMKPGTLKLLVVGTCSALTCSFCTFCRRVQYGANGYQNDWEMTRRANDSSGQLTTK